MCKIGSLLWVRNVENQEFCTAKHFFTNRPQGKGVFIQADGKEGQTVALTWIVAADGDWLSPLGDDVAFAISVA